ncbi:hypothetical protein FKP32DRAFT_1591801 [Trametes sanguinea]|nr:hypothetical protein FKP32DRAFT_1591801 [Trametes sanguinea]
MPPSPPSNLPSSASSHPSPAARIPRILPHPSPRGSSVRALAPPSFPPTPVGRGHSG